MQLVKASAHEATFPHGGSVSQFEKHFDVKYGTADAVEKLHTKGWLKGRVPKALKGKCQNIRMLYMNNFFINCEKSVTKSDIDKIERKLNYNF
jgi:hypothetical protein